MAVLSKGASDPTVFAILSAASVTVRQKGNYRRKTSRPKEACREFSSTGELCARKEALNSTIGASSLAEAPELGFKPGTGTASAYRLHPNHQCFDTSI